MKSESEVAQSCPNLSDPMDCSLLGSSVHGSFQARILEWGAIAFSEQRFRKILILKRKLVKHQWSYRQVETLSECVWAVMSAACVPFSFLPHCSSPPWTHSTHTHLCLLSLAHALSLLLHGAHLPGQSLLLSPFRCYCFCLYGRVRPPLYHLNSKGKVLMHPGLLNALYSH